MNAISRHTKGDAHKKNITPCVQKCTRPVVRHHSLPLFLQTYTLRGAHAEAAMLILLFLSWNNTTNSPFPGCSVCCLSLWVAARPVDCGGRVKLKKKKSLRGPIQVIIQGAVWIFGPDCVYLDSKNTKLWSYAETFSQMKMKSCWRLVCLFFFTQSLIYHVVQPEARPQDTPEVRMKVPQV